MQRKSDEELLCILSIPYVDGASLRFKRIREHYNIRTDIKLIILLEFICEKQNFLRTNYKDHIFRFCVNVEVIWA